ncbi:MAG: sigma-70 family RNA polymerase sigma factor [Clostridiaceae bacterium]|nr:sigma-70 family RNA polymerase sigma factor [Eubacteriales bacterium]
MEREFEAVYAANAQMVYWTAYGITRSGATAADIAQTTFLKVCEHWSTLKRLNAPQQRSYIYKTCRGLSLNRLKRDKREGADLSVLESADGLSPMEELFEERELVRLVREKLNALPELYRTPLLLHYYAELSTKEAARALGIPEGTYRSRLSRARTLLKQALEAEVNRYA